MWNGFVSCGPPSFVFFSLSRLASLPSPRAAAQVESCTGLRRPPPLRLLECSPGAPVRLPARSLACSPFLLLFSLHACSGSTQEGRTSAVSNGKHVHTHTHMYAACTCFSAYTHTDTPPHTRAQPPLPSHTLFFLCKRTVLWHLWNAHLRSLPRACVCPSLFTFFFFCTAAVSLAVACRVSSGRRCARGLVFQTATRLSAGTSVASWIPTCVCFVCACVPVGVPFPLLFTRVPPSVIISPGWIFAVRPSYLMSLLPTPLSPPRGPPRARHAFLPPSRFCFLPEVRLLRNPTCAALSGCEANYTHTHTLARTP